MGCPSAAPTFPLTLALVLLSAAVRADAVLDVSGNVVATAPRLTLRVTLTNRGDARAGPIEVRGELLGEPATARLRDGLAPGAEGNVTLAFDATPPRPGLHALTLLVEHPLVGTPDAASNPPMASQRAYLLLALGANPGEAVRIEADPMRLDVRGTLVVRLQSRDGEAQRVRLRALTARGLRPDTGPIEVSVPPDGHATVRVPIVRAGAPPGSRQALLLVAETLEGPLERTSVAAASIELAPDPARLPRLRAPLLAIGLALLALALGYEIWTRLRARALLRA